LAVIALHTVKVFLFVGTIDHATVNG
jgi:hypothetical protein